MLDAVEHRVAWHSDTVACKISAMTALSKSAKRSVNGSLLARSLADLPG